MTTLLQSNRFGAPTWAQAVASSTPWAWWRLNDGDFYIDGNLVIEDASGNGRVGRFNGDQIAPERWRNPLVRTGSYGIKVGTGAGTDLRPPSGGDILGGMMAAGPSFTFGFWLRGTTATAFSTFVSGGNFFRVGINHNLVTAATAVGHISWLASTTGADAHALDSGAVNWNDGASHLVLFEYDSTADTVSIWFDGTRVATRSHAGITMPTTHTNSTLAGVSTASVNWELSDYLFYARVLSAAEHTSLASYAGPGDHPYGATWAPPYNTAAHLEIPVPGLSSTEAMHPDVVDFGSAWNGYRYWMAFTPFNGTADTEEPCIVATNDISAGGTWEVPAGYTNPLRPDPAGSAHCADTDLVYDPTTDRLYVLYTVDDGATFQDIRSKWTDGDGTWSSETTVLAGAAGTYANPSCVKTATGFRLYYNISDDTLRFRDTTSTPDTGYGSETTCTGLTPVYFQNINMVKDSDGTYVAVVSDATIAGGRGGRLFFARSTDGGTNFVVTGQPVLSPSAAGWDQSGIYRTAVLTDASGSVVVASGNIHLWYSGFINGTPAQWGTGYVQVPRAVLGA